MTVLHIIGWACVGCIILSCFAVRDHPRSATCFGLVFTYIGIVCAWAG